MFHWYTHLRVHLPGQFVIIRVQIFNRKFLIGSRRLGVFVYGILHALVGYSTGY